MSKPVKFTLHPIANTDELPSGSLYAILTDDDCQGYTVGTRDDVAMLAGVLLAFVRRGIVSNEIDNLDERLGWTWLSIAEAVRAASERGYIVTKVGLRRACSSGRIAGAKKDGPDWRFPQARFLAWLVKPASHKPGRRPK